MNRQAPVEITCWGASANSQKDGHHANRDEFTIDFVRMEYGETQTRGVVVTRVSVSPLFITQLIQALQDNWTTYAQKALPKEVTGDAAS